MNGTMTEEFSAQTVTKMLFRVKDLLLPSWMPLSFPHSDMPIVDKSTTLIPAFLQEYLPSYETLTDDPATLFHTLLVSLVTFTVSVRTLHNQLQSHQKKRQKPTHQRRASISQSPSLQWLQYKFLVVFWLLRTSFWMSGPYFYAAYASKTNGDPQLISQISLAGYGAIALWSPFLGKWTDKYGRKLGTLVATLLYAMGSLSVLANPLWLLFLGRALGGVGTSLLSAAPEAWLVSAYNHEASVIDMEIPTFLQQTFGLAYSYDSVCAIAAGQLAGLAASRMGPTGPFQASPVFLALGAILAGVLWTENTAVAAVDVSPSIPSDKNSNDESDSSSDSSGSPARHATIWDALKVIRSDPKIMFLGGVQSLFEGAMYIFVMQWPPTLNRAIQLAYGKKAVTPYGTAFSCFMACCMAGSTVFGILSKRNKNSGSLLSVEKQTVVLVAVASVSLIAATSAVAHGQELWQLTAAYFVFEACVGMYFPSIGTLRSNYIPDSHRSLIMTLFGVPLNVIVVTVFLFLHRLGDVGAMGVAAGAVGLATVCMVGLYITAQREKDRLEEEKRQRKAKIRNRFKKLILKAKAMRMSDVSDSMQEEFLRETVVQHKRERFSMGRQFCF